jgi:hypothetical protein
MPDFAGPYSLKCWSLLESLREAPRSRFGDQGPAESCFGRLPLAINWGRTARLSERHLAVLYTAGELDEARRRPWLGYQELPPNATRACARGRINTTV